MAGENLEMELVAGAGGGVDHPFDGRPPERIGRDAADY
jgi:hypothetical protein